MGLCAQKGKPTEIIQSYWVEKYTLNMQIILHPTAWNISVCDSSHLVHSTIQINCLNTFLPHCLEQPL